MNKNGPWLFSVNLPKQWYPMLFFSLMWLSEKDLKILALLQFNTFSCLVSSLTAQGVRYSNILTPWTAQILTYPWPQILLLWFLWQSDWCLYFPFYFLSWDSLLFPGPHIASTLMSIFFVEKHAKIYWYYKDWHSDGVPFVIGRKRTKFGRSN